MCVKSQRLICGNFSFERMVEALSSFPDIVVQSLFVQGSHDNTQPEAIEKWIQTLQRIKPREVQVYSIARGPADPGLREVSLEKLREIAKSCETKTGIQTVVFD